MSRGLILVAFAALAGGALSILTAARNEAAESPATLTVFTANTQSSNLSFVNGDTLSQASPTVGVGSSPNAVAVNPAGTRVAVTLRNSATVRITDTDGTNGVDVDLSGGTLNELAWSPDGTRIYATRSNARISVIDPAAGTEIDDYSIQMIGATNPVNPTSIAVSTGGTFLFILVADDGVVRKVQASDGTPVDSAAVDLASAAMAISVDRTRIIVVGPGAPRVFETTNLDAVGSLADIGDQVDVAVAGTRAYALNQASVPGDQDSPTKAKRGDPRSATAPTLTGVDVYNLVDGTLAFSTNFTSNATLHSVAVTPDGAKAFVARSGNEEAGSITRYDLGTGADEGTANVGNQPQDIALFAKPPVQDVVSYFLPRKVKLTVKGAGKDAIIASGFYDDAGATVDFNQDVTLTVGTFTRTFRLSPNKKGTTFTFKDATIKMVAVPKLKGSSRGRFRLAATKTTLGGLIPEQGGVDFHFTASGLPDAAGRIQLTDGAYKLGGKRGALEAPVFFAAKASATLKGADQDTLTFTGGFATGGTTPANLGAVLFGFGTFGPVQFDPLVRKGDVYKGQLVLGQGKVKITIDFLRETVVINATKIELGPLTDPTVDVFFDPGLGGGGSSNTIRLGGAGSVRKY